MTEQASKQTSETTPETGSQQALDTIQATLDKFLSAANVNAVYGEPRREGDTTIIPCAEILSGVGFGIGSGYGRGESPSESDKPASAGGGSGGGGGGRVLSRPVAVVVATPGNVEVKPIVDVTKVALAGITAWGFMFTMLIRMMSFRRGMGRHGRM